MAEELETPSEQPTPERNPLFKWYILHAYSGFERKVRESIESRVQAFGLKDKVGRVMIPTEPVTEIINGKKRTVERVFLPAMRHRGVDAAERGGGVVHGRLRGVEAV